MKKIIRLTFLLYSFIPFASFATMFPDSIGIKKTDGKNFLIHQIDSAEGWYSIARLYKISYAELRLANKDSSDKLIPGRTLLIPYNKLKVDDPHFDKNYIQSPTEIFYTVKAGETLFSIAKRFNTNVDSLKKWNNLTKAGLNYGKKLKVGYKDLQYNGKSDAAGSQNEKPSVEKKDSVVVSPIKPEKVESKNKKKEAKADIDSFSVEKKKIEPVEVKSEGKQPVEKKDTVVSSVITTSKVESKNKKKEAKAGLDSVSVEKKKIESVKVKQDKISSVAVHDSSAEMKKEQAYSETNKIKKNLVAKPDSSKQDKKTTPTQTKLIKTATNPSADTVKIIKTASAAKTDSKKGGTSQAVSKARKEVSESGVASWIQDDDINPNKYYALHRTAPIGTIVKVTNKMNKKYVFVKVVGTLPDTGDNTDLVIKISKASAEKLGVRDSRFQSELSYGVNEKP
ncbi:MAG: LysM peptidoglycan-binding domain-containing protein [Bacteroidetes bacterium]|nr:LysM peptidoglycan-binding domain-containing protein [Bacteroidota bacterium]